MARPAAAPRLEHRDAVHLGQADVEDDGVVGLGLAEKVAFLAVEGAVDHIARVGQRRRELAVEIGIVLDDEEAHIYPPPHPPVNTEPEVASTVTRVTLPSRASTVSI